MVECLLPKQKVVGSNPIARSMFYPHFRQGSTCPVLPVGTRCNRSYSEFPFRNFTVDHIENLQMLCGHYNRVKGDWPQEYLVARLRELGIAV